MFSNDDIREIFRLLPPTKDSGGPSIDLSSLLISTTENAFITTQQALDKFKSLVITEVQRLPVSSLSQEFDLDSEIILEFVRASPSLALLSENKLDVITKRERDDVEQKIFSLADIEIFSKASFSRQNDISIESIEALKRSRGDHEEGQGGLLEIDDYLFSKRCRQRLQDAIKGHLDEAISNTTTIELSPTQLPGAPPAWFISQTLIQVLDANQMAPEFNVIEDAAIISCVPKQSVLKKRDAEVEWLRSGNIPCIELQKFAKEFVDLYPSLQDVQDHFKSFPDIYLNGSTAVSKIWLSVLGAECVHSLTKSDFVDLTVILQDQVPADNLTDVRARLVEQVHVAYEQRHASTQAKIHDVGNYILTEDYYEGKKQSLHSSAETLALRQWQQLLEAPEKDIKFQMSDVIALIPSDEVVLLALSQDKGVQKAVEDAYWGIVSTEESKNEEHFSAFWIERVVSRTRNHTQALGAIEETKLQDSLSELLASYLLKELLPDSISKAQSQGLVRSRRTRKNVQRLESTLKTGRSDASSVVSALEKFAKKQGTQEVSDEAIVGAKKVLVQDMVRRMHKQKQKDGPLLFLTLVIVLFGRHHPGVVYATGKFAPKLLKQLKASVEPGQFEQLEDWKDKAKAGTLLAEDTERMKQLATDGV